MAGEGAREAANFIIRDQRAFAPDPDCSREPSELSSSTSGCSCWPPSPRAHSCSGPCSAAARRAARSPPPEAVRLINREKAVLIDVCEPAEFAAGHAARRAQRPARLARDVDKDLPKNKALPVVVVCASGARATRAVAILKKLGFENVRMRWPAAWRPGARPTCRSRSRPPDGLQPPDMQTRADVHQPDLPLLRACQAPARTARRDRDRRGAHRPGPGRARDDDASDRAGARCRRSSSARRMSAAATT